MLWYFLPWVPSRGSLETAVGSACEARQCYFQLNKRNWEAPGLSRGKCSGIFSELALSQRRVSVRKVRGYLLFPRSLLALGDSLWLLLCTVRSRSPVAACTRTRVQHPSLTPSHRDLLQWPDAKMVTQRDLGPEGQGHVLTYRCQLETVRTFLEDLVSSPARLR